MTRDRLAWGSAALAMVVFILLTLVGSPDGSVLLWLPVVALFVSIGALLTSRVPANPIGPMFLLAGILIVAFSAFGVYATLAETAVPPWPGAGMARTLGNILFFYPIMIALVGIPLVFPDGRLASPRFRWVAGLTIVGLIAWTIGASSEAGSDTGSLTDPLVFVATIVGFLGATVSVAVRSRSGDPMQRQQVKWLLADAAVAAIAFPLALSMPDPETSALPVLALAAWILAILTLLFLPVVIGIAVMRYRLYDIDRIVSRTVSYAVVTAILAAVFGVCVIGSSGLLAGLGQGDSIAVAMSTLAVFAITQPVLQRVRHRVDRRFNRARYDAESTATSFSTRLRNEVDIDAVSADLRDTVEGAVRPVALGLWIRDGLR